MKKVKPTSTPIRLGLFLGKFERKSENTKIKTESNTHATHIETMNACVCINTHPHIYVTDIFLIFRNSTHTIMTGKMEIFSHFRQKWNEKGNRQLNSRRKSYSTQRIQFHEN